LIADRDVYSQFQDHLEMQVWADEYKKHSEIVYRFLTSGEGGGLCGEDFHLFEGESGLCSNLWEKVNLMRYHINECEGYQSQSFMRAKIFGLLYDDIQGLPKSSLSKQSKHVARYIHSLGVVLINIRENEDWIQHKIYGSEDFAAYSDMAARVANVMKNLIKSGTFDDPNMYKSLIVFTNIIHDMCEFCDQINDQLRDVGWSTVRFFTKQFVKVLDDAVISMKAKYGDWNAGGGGEEEKAEEDEDEEEAARG